MNTLKEEFLRSGKSSPGVTLQIMSKVMKSSHRGGLGAIYRLPLRHSHRQKLGVSYPHCMDKETEVGVGKHLV